VTPQIGNYNGATYEILTATTVVGNFANVTVNGNLAGTTTPNFTGVDLTVNGIVLIPTPAGLNGNQANVLSGINSSIVNGPANVPLPAQFVNLGNLTGPAQGNALAQLSGEVATGAERGAFMMMDQFLNLMLDPFVDGRSGNGWFNGVGQPLGFAPDQQAMLPPDVALAYDTVLKAPPKPAYSFGQRWSAWGAAYGGSGHANGDPAIGSNNVTASDFGFAAGMDYHATPNLVYGFALSGGGTNWNLAQGLGSGRSDAFQAGVYGSSRWGAAYVAAAAAFANHNMSTDRFALGDQLTASFNAQSYAARVEAGYRYGVPMNGTVFGFTPYGALQAQSFHTPNYAETDLTGGALALNFASMNSTDTRSELGARFDDLVAVGNGMPLELRARVAWAHDWVSNPALSAAFQALPGSTFVVNGAPVPQNSALTTALAELHINQNWSVTAKFDGEFASGSQIYAGTGTLRYSW
jgi:hypothetical protein